MRTGEQEADVGFTDDVFFHILLWLPVTSLLRFKSVCKSWRALIQCSAFAHHHLHANISDEQNYSLVLMDPFNAHGSYLAEPGPLTISLVPSYLTAVADTNSHKQLLFDLPGFSDFFLCKLQLFTCNGILCLHTQSHGYFIPEKCKVSLWNPATKEISVLPPPPFPPTLPDPNPYISVGFGLDLKTNDYKLVRFFTFGDFLLHVNHVEVYSLGTDTWRIIDAVLPVNFVSSDSRALYRMGTYCWVGTKKYPSDITLQEDSMIFTYDFGSEVFETMSLPEVDSVKYSINPLIAIVRDNIACINSVGPVDNSHYEIWVLNEYGIKESWTQLYKVGPFDTVRQLGISKTGRLLLFGSHYQLCVHDLATQETRELSVQGGNLFHIRQLQVALYKESLVSVKRGNRAANTLTSAV